MPSASRLGALSAPGLIRQDHLWRTLVDEKNPYDRGTWTPSYNKAVEDREPPEAPGEEEAGKPPVFGLQDGPKPPAGIREAVNAEVRAQEARDKAYAKMEKRDQKVYNKTNELNDENQGDNGGRE